MDFIDTAVDALADGVSLEIVGRPGSGRSLLVNDLVDTLREKRVKVVRVWGIGPMKDRPMAAFVTSVAGLDVTGSVAETAERLVEELGTHGVLVVDDADDLDDATAGVLIAVLANLSIPMVIGRRTAGRPPEHLRRLLARLTPCIRHEVPPLTYEAMRKLLQQRMRAPIDPTALARVVTLSGGLPSIARAIARAAWFSGSIMRVDNVWQVTGPLVTPQVGQAIDQLLVDASDDDVEALTLLAIAGPMSITHARALLSPKRLERLSDLGLIDYIDGPNGGVVATFPPVVGEYLRISCTASRRVMVREQLAEHGLPMPLAFTAATPAGLETGAATVSQALADHQTAKAFTFYEQWQQDRSALRAALLLEALFETAHFVADPGDIWLGTNFEESPAEDCANAQTWYAMHRWLIQRDIHGCMDLLADVSKRYPGHDGFAIATRLHLTLLNDGVTPEHLVRPDGDPRPHDARVAVYTEALTARGDVQQSLATLRDFAPTNSFIRHHRDIQYGVSLLLDGQVEAALNYASEGLVLAQRELSTGPFQGHGYVVALASAIMGRMGRVEQVVSQAMTLTSVAELHVHYLTGIFGIADAHRRWVNAKGTAQDLSFRDAALGRPGIYPLSVHPQTCRCSTPAETLWCEARWSAERGYLGAAAFAAVEAADYQRNADELERVTALLGDLKNPPMLDLVALAHAITHHDVAELERLEQAMAERSAWMYVARAGVHRAMALREQGNNAAAASLMSKLWMQVIPVTDGLEPIFARFAEVIELSPRELEIARYAVQGRTAVDIATELVLSVRTVEHHLFNTYRKLGVDSRDQLRAAFETWLLTVWRPAVPPTRKVPPAPYVERSPAHGLPEPQH